MTSDFALGKVMPARCEISTAVTVEAIHRTSTDAVTCADRRLNGGASVFLLIFMTSQNIRTEQRWVL